MIRGKFAIKVMAGLVLAITVFVPASKVAQAQTGEPNITAQLVIQVQELQDEVRTLRGRMEAQEQELENLKQRQRDQYLDLDQRISDQRSRLPAGVSDGEEPAVANGSAPVAGPAEDVPEVRAPMETESETVPIAPPKVESQSLAATAADEKAAYDKAFQALKELRYADAAEEFQSFVEKYPDSEYADNAQYWLGESYYVTRNYDIALVAFQRLMDRFPDSPKVPDALLKVGYTYYELKQWDSALSALTQVQKNYPDTTLARLAESRLRSMRMEGHY